MSITALSGVPGDMNDDRENLRRKWRSGLRKVQSFTNKNFTKTSLEMA
jgi:hypothetical protein